MFSRFQTTFVYILGPLSAEVPHVQALMFCRGYWSDRSTCLRCMEHWLLSWWGGRRTTLWMKRCGIGCIICFEIHNHQPSHQALIVCSPQAPLDDILQSLIDSQADTPATQLCHEGATIMLELVKVIIMRVRTQCLYFTSIFWTQFKSVK